MFLYPTETPFLSQWHLSLFKTSKICEIWWWWWWWRWWRKACSLISSRDHSQRPSPSQNLRHFASKVWTYAEPLLRLSWMIPTTPRRKKIFRITNIKYWSAYLTIFLIQNHLPVPALLICLNFSFFGVDSAMIFPHFAHK